MIPAAFKEWRRSLEALFPERQIYIRSEGAMRVVVLSSARQAAAAAVTAGVALWLVAASAIAAASMFGGGEGAREAAQTRAYYERLIADRQARLDSAVAQLSSGGGSAEALAAATERRHAALALMFANLEGAPGPAAAPLRTLGGSGPLSGLRAVRDDQDRLIAEAQTFARSRADRLRLAFRLAGLDPAAYSRADGSGLGGPLVEAGDPRALAAVLDVDPGFAERIQHAAADLADMRALSSASTALPLARPTANVAEASGFGVRIDPFTGRPAFHPGLDFPAPPTTPVFSTAPGVVSFAGVRNGYGNTVEIDHGHGFKTRFAHLSSISVSVGQTVGLHQRLGAVGSTGRSTGPHLHYEVWVDGRPQNPERFLKAGDYVQQAG